MLLMPLFFSLFFFIDYFRQMPRQIFDYASLIFSRRVAAARYAAIAALF